MRITDIKLAIPDKMVTNEDIVNAIPSSAEHLEHLFEAMKKKVRFFSTNKTSTELAIDSVGTLIEENDVRETVSALLFVSQTPEYLMPTNATLIHNYYKLNPNCMCMDLNSNCAGMVTALDMANALFKAHPEFQQIIVVGAEQHSKHLTPRCLVTTATFADMSVAVLLERSDNTIYETKHHTLHMDTAVRFPKDGMSNVSNNELSSRILWDTSQRPTVELVTRETIPLALELMSKYSITGKDIKLLATNQQSDTLGNYLSEALSISKDAFNYIGDTYGYTGSTSALLSLSQAVTLGDISRGDLILLCSFGAGGISVTTLLEY